MAERRPFLAQPRSAFVSLRNSAPSEFCRLGIAPVARWLSQVIDGSDVFRGMGRAFFYFFPQKSSARRFFCPHWISNPAPLFRQFRILQLAFDRSLFFASR